MTITDDCLEMLQKDPRYISIKRFDYDIDKLLARYPDGCPDHVIAGALVISEDEVERRYQAVVEKLRDLMGIRY